MVVILEEVDNWGGLWLAIWREWIVWWECGRKFGGGGQYERGCGWKFGVGK